MDPVADALIRIKNGYMARQNEVNVLHSKLIFGLCKLLEKEGFIKECLQKDGKITVILKYTHKQAAISEVQRVSKPGRRIYRGVRNLPKALGGAGVAIISTPKGLMTGKDAKKEGVGGEVMAFVW